MLFAGHFLLPVPQARFREAVTRMEGLMEEEAKESASAIKNLRDKAMLAKDRYAHG